MAQESSLRIVYAAAPAEPAPEALRPRETRYRVMLAGLIGRAGASHRLPMKVRNISAHGLEAETAYPPDAGDMVDVILPRLGRISGCIRWGLHGRIGIEFAAPVDPRRAFTRAETAAILHHSADCKRPPMVWKH